MSVQRIVEDSPAIDLQAEAQHTSGEIENPVSIFRDPATNINFNIPHLFSATLSLEVRSNLPIETHPLGERRFPKSHDAQRGQIEKSHLFGSTLCGHYKNQNYGRPGTSHYATSEDFHRKNSNHVAVNLLSLEWTHRS